MVHDIFTIYILRYIATHKCNSKLGWYVSRLMLFKLYYLLIKVFPKKFVWRMWLNNSAFSLKDFIEILQHWSLLRWHEEKSQAGTGVQCHTGYRERSPFVCCSTVAKRARCSSINPQLKGVGSSRGIIVALILWMIFPLSWHVKKLFLQVRGHFQEKECG